MAVLLNRVHPYMQIFVPLDGTWRAFQGGRLTIEEDDLAYPIVMEEASRNPYIVILDKGVQCDVCGEVYAGNTAKANLAKHRKDVHFEEWVADKLAPVQEEINAEVKARAGIACDACRPAQVFPDEAALQAHVSIVHLSAPPMDAEGNEIGREREVEAATSIPAATPKT